MDTTSSRLDSLLATAALPDAARAWPAAASALQLLFWQDRFAEAADLAVRTIEQFGPTDRQLAQQKRPFDDALLAAQLHADVAAKPRLEKLTTALPAGSVLGKRLIWLAQRVDTVPLHTLMTGYQDWDEPTGTLFGPDAALAKRAPASLTANEREQLWQACQSDNCYDIAARLFDTTGQQPARWFAAAWFAGHLIRRGQTAEASTLLFDALPNWKPLEAWDLLPTDVVLQPQLRPAVSTEVRQGFLASVATAPDERT